MNRFVGGTVALALAVTGVPAAPASAQPTPTSPPPVVVPVPNSTPVEWPVLDITPTAETIAGVQDMHFTSANSDGSATETEDGHSRVYVLKADVMFAYNKATLTAKARATLTDIAAKIAAANVIELTVVGHTDSDGADAHNLTLSKKRAKAVAAFLAARLPATTTIKAVGKGETQPRSTNVTTFGRALNRRVEITAR